jgi:hypothetical protein
MDRVGPFTYPIHASIRAFTRTANRKCAAV